MIGRTGGLAAQLIGQLSRSSFTWRSLRWRLPDIALSSSTHSISGEATIATPRKAKTSIGRTLTSLSVRTGNRRHFATFMARLKTGRSLYRLNRPFSALVCGKFHGWSDPKAALHEID
jgi:hypothetical protein